jgi:predicted DNA-binding transcriptional regulator
VGGNGETRDWERRVAENARRFRELRNRLAGQSVREVSRDGAVEVTVSTSGVLAGLVLRERRPPVPLSEIAAEVMDCVRRAQSRIPDLVRQAVVDTVGEHDPGAHLVLAEARERFPAAGNAPWPASTPPGTSHPVPPQPVATHSVATHPVATQSAPRPVAAREWDEWDGPEIFDRG